MSCGFPHPRLPPVNVSTPSSAGCCTCATPRFSAQPLRPPYTARSVPWHCITENGIDREASAPDASTQQAPLCVTNLRHPLRSTRRSGLL
jgi:hypothetical protein